MRKAVRIAEGDREVWTTRSAVGGARCWAETGDDEHGPRRDTDGGREEQPRGPVPGAGGAEAFMVVSGLGAWDWKTLTRRTTR